MKNILKRLIFLLADFTLIIMNFKIFKSILIGMILFLLSSCTAEQFFKGTSDAVYNVIAYGGKLKTQTVIYTSSEELKNSNSIQEIFAERNLIISSDSLCCRYSIHNIYEYNRNGSKCIKYDFIDGKTASVKHYDKQNSEKDGIYLYEKVAGHLVYLIKRIEKKENKK